MAQDNVKAESSGGGSGKMLLVLGLLGGIALGGGLGYFYSKQSAQEAAHDEAAAEKPQKPKGELLAVTFERLAVPIYSHKSGSSRFVGNYFVDIEVQTRGAANQIAIRKAEPRLQHAFLSAISKAELMKEDAPLELDVDKLSAALKAKSDEVMGAGVVESVSIINALRLSR